jgi:hypothetical protein
VRTEKLKMPEIEKSSSIPPILETIVNSKRMTQSGFGTAIFISASLNFEVIQSLFTNCIASSQGGAIDAYRFVSGGSNYSKFEN